MYIEREEDSVDDIDQLILYVYGGSLLIMTMTMMKVLTP